MKVVILGGGFAGISAKLFYPNSILVDENDFVVNTPKLVEVIENKDLKISHALIHRKVDLKARVLNVNFKDKEVITTEGNIKFDKLIISLGYEQDLSKIKGAEKYAIGFTLQNIEKIRNFRENSTVTILGGGALGVELAGALKKRGFNVNLIEAEKRLVPYLPSNFSIEVQKTLENLGVNIILNGEVEEVREKEVITSQGIVKTDYIIFSAGFSGPKIIKELGLTNKSNRMLVDEYLRSEDYDFVYGAGDCANFKNGFIPQSAQVAFEAGKIAVKNAVEGDTTIFKPNQRAVILKIGNEYIGLFKNNVIKGTLSKLIKIYAINSFENKVSMLNTLSFQYLQTYQYF